MSSKTPFELLSVAASLFPKQLLGESESDKIAALRKSALLFDLAKEVLEHPDAEMMEAAHASDEKDTQLVRFNHPELIRLSATICDPRENPSETAKRVHRKAMRRARALQVPCPSLKEGISLGAAEIIFAAPIKPGPRPRQRPKRAGT